MAGSDAVRIKPTGLRTLLGIETTKNSSQNGLDDISRIERYTPGEAGKFLRRTYVPPKEKQALPDALGAISYLHPLHKKIGERIMDADKMLALAPEIEQSKVLVSSSIMSPNDLQDGEFIFSFEKIPAISSDPDLVKHMSELYDALFNKVLQLGLKSYDWIGEIQYRSGSKCILILPQATQQEIHNRTVQDAAKSQWEFTSRFAGFASFQDYMKHMPDNENLVYSTEDFNVKWRDSFANSTSDVSGIIKESIPALESFGIDLPKNFIDKDGKINTHTEHFECMEAMVVNMRTKLNEGDVIRMSENPEIVRFNIEHKKQNKQKQLNSLKKLYKNVFPVETMVQLDANPDNIPHSGHPTVIEIPSEAVIPIAIPGSPKEHIGYFILLDNYGQPLTIEASGLDKDSIRNLEGSNPNGAYEALYGTYYNPTFLSKQNFGTLPGTVLFQNLLDKYIKSRIKGIFGRDDLKLSRFQALSTTMFYRLLDNKETTLLFVPPSLLHYFAFAYDSKGIGVSKLKDIQFLLSLRTTLMMADVVAKVNDAVEHKKISFNVDEKAANVESIMDLITNIFIAKNKLNGSIDPSEIITEMYSNALTVVPKNIPGIADLDISIENNSNQSTRPDDALIEQLNNLLISHLDVPPSALNQMSEPEFAKSIITNNLFFAKKIARYQNIWCEQITDFIRDYALFDIDFQTTIKKKLQATGKHRIKENLPDNVKKVKDKNTGKYNIVLDKNDANYDKKIDSLIASIISNVEVSLPVPNIVVNNTQLEEINNFSSLLDTLADKFFPSEIIHGDDQRGNQAIGMIKAEWKRSALLEFIERLGQKCGIVIPDYDGIDFSNAAEIIQSAWNIEARAKAQLETLTKYAERNSSGMGDDGFGGGGDDFGMGGGNDGFDMGGDEGGDMGGGDIDMGDMNIDMGDEETPPDIEEGSSDEGNGEDSYASMYFKRKK